jgi:hypothetical protein
MVKRISRQTHELTKTKNAYKINPKGAENLEQYNEMAINRDR